MISPLDTPIWLHLRNAAIWLYPSFVYSLQMPQDPPSPRCPTSLTPYIGGRSPHTCPGCLHAPTGPNRCASLHVKYGCHFLTSSLHSLLKNTLKGGESQWKKNGFSRTIIDVRSSRSGTGFGIMYGLLWKTGSSTDGKWCIDWSNQINH